MQLHLLEAAEALAALHAKPEGLDPDEAKQRLAELGPNEVERPAREPWWKRFARELTHFFALILWAAAALAFVAAWFSPGEGMGTLGFAILGVILINGAFSFWQEHEAEQAIDALQALLPRAARVRRGGAVSSVPVREIVPGDMILLSAGDAVPADAMLIAAFGLRVNTATITRRAPSDPRYLVATSAALVSVVIMQVANVLACRSHRRSAFGRGFLGNPLLFWAILAELVLLFLVVYTPPGQAIFGTRLRSRPGA